jgi:hypothetical protein
MLWICDDKEVALTLLPPFSLKSGEESKVGGPLPYEREAS